MADGLGEGSEAGEVVSAYGSELYVAGCVVLDEPAEGG